MAREKILVVDGDLDSLSKIYLALVHRKFKTEACNNPEEINSRLKRFRPSVIILNLEEYNLINKKLKIPAVVLLEEEYTGDIQLNYGDVILQRPVQVDKLVKTVETLI